MKRYDTNTPITFQKGYWQFCPQANFNFQLNRVIMWDGGRKEDVDKIGASVTSSEAWVRAMRRLTDEAHAEGRTRNEIAYRRMTEFFMYDSDPDKRKTYEDAAALFYDYYGDYFDRGIVTRAQVPYGNGYLPVMSVKAKGERVDTIVLHGGNDRYFEEFFFAMLYLAERGFDVYLFEGPGQGGVLRVQDMKFDYQWEKPVKAVLDHFSLNDVTIIGASLGGYLAPRAAAFEKRIKRVVGWSIFPDFFDVVIADHPGAMRSAIGGIFKLGLGKAMNGMYDKMMEKDELVRWNLLHGMYAYDAKTPDEYIRRIRKFTLKGIANRITQDVLILGAREDHFIMPKLFHEEYDLLTNVRSLTLSLMTDRQDAGAHCNVGNTKLALDTMADWIARTKAV